MAHTHPSPSPPPPPLPSTSTASPPQASPLSPLHADLLAKLHLEQAIADGAENLLAVFQAEEQQQQLQDGSAASNKHDLKLQVERELQGARSRIAEVEDRIRRLIEQEQLSGESSRPSEATASSAHTRRPARSLLLSFTLSERPFERRAFAKQYHELGVLSLRRGSVPSDLGKTPLAAAIL